MIMKKKILTKNSIIDSLDVDILKERLDNAIKKHETRKRKLKSKRIKGFHILEKLPRIAEDLGFSVEEMVVFYKISGKKPNKAIYVSKRGGRVDLAGFILDSPVVIPIPKDEIKRRHLGRIKAKLAIDNINEELVMATYKDALDKLNE